MEGSIIFYTYGSTLELNGQQFEAGRLTEDLLNLSPDDYHPLHERMVRIRTLMDIYEYVRKSELWWKLNDEMEQLCQELRRYTVFRLLPDDCYDAFFSVIREITGQFSLFPPEEHSLSEDDQTKLLSASAEEFFQSDDGDSDPEISLGLLDLFRRREGSEEKGELFYYEMFRLLGACEDTWSAYKKYIDRYMMYLHDIRAFVPTIRNFIKFILSTLTTNGPESYAAALYGFYNDDRTAEKLIVNPITYHGDCYRRHDEYMLSYVPRELPDGSMAICQEHVTDSLQALMKADYSHGWRWPLRYECRRGDFCYSPAHRRCTDCRVPPALAYRWIQRRFQEQRRHSNRPTFFPLPAICRYPARRRRSRQKTSLSDRPGLCFAASLPQTPGAR